MQIDPDVLNSYACNSDYLFKHLDHQGLLDLVTAALPYQALHIHLVRLIHAPAE
ncbi:hypothetical protein [Marinobacter panjinensis]|uniref:hypothetical protein n=1 Tax=Marinobacter panjinensis TaxID=2576384 RepID=UPI0014856A0A|nr:hypothetical protein [Marinobacter panjinensis]MCR8913326.1 hypothetical protein [Marinobacter panjinensis]